MEHDPAAEGDKPHDPTAEGDKPHPQLTHVCADPSVNQGKPWSI